MGYVQIVYFCQLLRVTRKRSCTSAGNAQAQLHFRDDQQRAFGISNISTGGAGKARFNVATPTYEAPRAKLVRDRYMYSIRITV